MSRYRGVGFLVLVVHLLDARPSSAVEGLAAAVPQLRMLDARVNARQSLSNALRARPAEAIAARQTATRSARDRAAAIAGLRAAIPGLEVRISPATGAPAVVARRGGALTAPLSAVSNEQIVRGFLNAHGGVYGLSQSDLEDLVVLGDSSGGASGLRMVRMEQQIDGRPVFQSETRFLIDREGRVWRSVGQLVPGARALAAKAGSGALIDPSEAVVRLLESAALRADASAFTVRGQETGWTRLSETSDAVDGEISAREVFFPLAPGLLVPAWALVVSTAAADWYAVVDAQTGDLLWRKNIRNAASAHDARFRVYVQADGTTPADSPAPQSPSAAAPGAGTQFTEIAPTIVSMHAAMNATASPNGWINDCPGGVCTANETQTLGNNVLACLDRTVTGPGNNVCDTSGANSLDGNGRPTGNPDSATRNRDFLGLAPRDFQTTFLPPPQGGNPESGQSPVQAAFGRGSVTQQFYAANWYHDQLYALGFDEAAGNFQTTNFSGMGLGGDRVLLDVQDGSGTDNANFSTPPDGVSGRAQMYRFTGPTIDRDGGIDSEILFHELTHGTSNRLVGNGAGLNWDPAAGMGEGWSDFYALSLLNNTNADTPSGNYASGAYATYKAFGFTTFLDNYVYGIRRFPYSTNNAVNPLTWADVSDVSWDPSGGIAISPLGFEFGGGAEVHNAGEIWALTLWEVRSRIIADPAGANGSVPTGSNTALEIVTDGLKMTPVDPSFVEARDAILDADCAANSCANEESIWGGFADRGLGYGAESPYNVGIAFIASHQGVVESFEAPYLDVVDPSADVAIDDSAGNNSGGVDPGETVDLTVTLTNPWRAAGKSIASATATLSTSTSGVTIPDNSSTYGAIAAQGSGAGDSFTVAVDADLPCGSAIHFTITTTSALGTTADDFTVRLGVPNGTDSVVTYTRNPSPDLAIGDRAPQGVFDQMVIADDYQIADLDFRVDSLTHPRVVALNVMLQAPSGLGIDMVGLTGFSSANQGSGDDLVNTRIDDDQPLDAAHDMTQAPNAGNSPGFDGPWVPVYNSPGWPAIVGAAGDPVGNLTRFDGMSTQGTWSALASDQLSGDTGTFNAWSILATPVHFDCTAVTGMLPVALAIDGNGVLEAGETAAVQPTWLNNTGSTQVGVTGVGSLFSGPAGPLYAITDPTADYGTVTQGNDASCTGGGDCYGVSITTVSRPTLHWDTTMLETLTTGDTKTWTLHVGDSFTDAPSSDLFYLPVEALLHRGVSPAGCGGGNYCPTDAVTREEMALLLVRALGAPLASCAGTYADVQGGPFCPAIERATTLGIFEGCDPSNFCPGLPVTREQMALFVLRAFEGSAYVPPACFSSPYLDVSQASFFCPWIQELKLRAQAFPLSLACDGQTGYCPSGPLRRDALARELTRVFGLQLYKP